MGLFTTKRKRTYHRTQPKRGWSTTVTAKTKAKRWFRRGRKKLWRKAKARIKRTWKQQRTANSRVTVRTVHPTPSYQYDTNGNVTPTNGTTHTAGQAKLPPPDGAMATCRRCANEVQYNDTHQRWEHTAKGNWECFQPHK